MNKIRYIILKNQTFPFYIMTVLGYIVSSIVLSIFKIHDSFFAPLFYFSIVATLYYALMCVLYFKINKFISFIIFWLGMIVYAFFSVFSTNMVCGNGLYIIGLIPTMVLCTLDSNITKKQYTFFTVIALICVIVIFFYKLFFAVKPGDLCDLRLHFYHLSQIYYAAVVLTILFYSCITAEIKLKRDRLKIQFKQKELEYMANHDPLTGFMNRRRMVKILTACDVSKKTLGADYAIAIFDIDDFKHVNDTYGHSCGDFILTSFTKRMRTFLPLENKIARWGGEEFVVVWPVFDDEILAQIDAVRLELSRTKFNYNGTDISISATFGICSSRHIDGWEAVLGEADEQLLHGKQHGKNCLVVSNKY